MAETITQEYPRTAFELYITSSYNNVVCSSSSRESACRKMAYIFKAASTPQGDTILKWMFEKQVFSRLVFKEMFRLLDNTAFPFLRGMCNNDLLTIIGVLKTRGKSSPVYLIDGGDRSKVPDAVREHQFLHKDSTPVSLEYAAMEAVYEEIVSTAIARARYVKTKIIPLTLIHELFNEKGLKVVPSGKIKSMLAKRGWRIDE